MPGLLHGFSTRKLSEELDKIRAFEERGFKMDRARQLGQPHGNLVSVWDEVSIQDGALPPTDASITKLEGVPLVIRVADCGPVFFYDPVRRAIGLAHSGKKGTEGNIVGETIEKMVKCFGSKPSDLLVQLGPCIRPPHYEVHFAQQIGEQAKKAGVIHFEDCGICTAARVKDYFSYRTEKGNTGRMWAVIMMTE